MPVKIPVEISARHIHLSQGDLEVLFGKGYCLTQKKALTQPDEFAAQETVTVRFQDKEIPQVRVIIPLRPRTQLEISLTDAYGMGLLTVIKQSGDLKGTPGVLLMGPKGRVELKEGVIVAQRHLHVSFREALKLGINGQKTVSVKVNGQRMTTFHNILVRKAENYRLTMHLDTDEGNAAGIADKTFGELII
ncbi:MAG: Phosphate propanoyltransferase [Parcubacteria group bacterium GW2011_GWB1_43_6]|nr:MAG: Phosphate propanoyltransferase [Parcubacteria group bacterium GW2011_GWB1_43_6]